MFGMQCEISSAIQTLISVEDSWLEYKGIELTFTEALWKKLIIQIHLAYFNFLN